MTAYIKTLDKKGNTYQMKKEKRMYKQGHIKTKMPHVSNCLII